MAEEQRIQAVEGADITYRKIIVAAIDFGSAYSGYAFSFHNEYKSNPIHISCNHWQSAKSGFMSLKTPSVLLLDTNKEFHKFGYEAEDKYAELIQMKVHKDWHYFTDIKMKLMNALDTFNQEGAEEQSDLFKERLTRTASIQDTEGRDFPLLNVMSMCFKYLVDHLLQQLDDKGLLGSITPTTDIQWVITVPAIWTDASKQFTKLAAVEAELDPRQVMLAYEPESAALFCRLLPEDRFLSEKGEKELLFSTFERGKKFMVLDLGGGTVDISVQETTKDGHMKSIHKVCGGPWGGYAVDMEFRKCLIDIIGEKAFELFKTTLVKEYLAFFRDFELKKRQVRLHSDASTTLRVPAALADLLEDECDKTLEDALDQSSFKGKITSKRDKLVFTHDTFTSFFNSPVKSIVKHVSDIMKHDRCQDLKGILLVGGFAESEFVIEALRAEFPEKRFIVPNEAGLSVVKGAVLYGHDPNIICTRTCRYTYGTSVACSFDGAIHPIERRITISNEFYCRDCFNKTFTIDELVNVGDKKSLDTTYDFRDADRQCGRLMPLRKDVLITKSRDSAYSEENGVTKLGTIEISLDHQGDMWPEIFACTTHMEIAGTEIEVTVELSTGHKKKGRFEFLIE